MANQFKSSTCFILGLAPSMADMLILKFIGYTTRVFGSSKIGNAQLQKEVFAYAGKLGGGKLTSVSNSQGRWYIKTAEGATINVRSVSSTFLPDGSQPRWTIEIL
ncbi:hypothetical protein [Neisseria sp. 83E34]|uniref:hypothetical protein n=1 Tax=Neisseria sp. 83E34 TaxID=1692264 RepID=UPI0006CE7965|nr:hypothetical protein [Neisseria sp. 83E34]KPN71940.1 hypothetical protein AKG09_04390 [Neisseria sp. 83E34]